VSPGHGAGRAAAAGARRRLLRAGLALPAGAIALPLPAGAAQRPRDCGEPGPWEAFRTRFLAADGRVIDPSSDRARTVSEAQAYALFFSLVANDRERFELMLHWTRDNLAAGDLAARLPAWSWGRREDESWGTLDANSASDADLWLAYALAQAGRLWDHAPYRQLADAIARRILDEECASLPGLGLMLLPGRKGFTERDAAQGEAAGSTVAWRLNPSYAPPFLLRWFARNTGDPRWGAVREGALRILRESSPAGFAPDWARYEARAGAPPGFVFGPRERVGSYDAIRVYLWVGMTSAADPEQPGLIAHFAPMSALAAGAGAPETIDILDGRRGAPGPAAFGDALLPLLRASGRRAKAAQATAGGYYEEALRLFGRQWAQERFSFAPDGALVTAWKRCAP
jgi:endo-1,4-beta-D-glucanase Y